MRYSGFWKGFTGMCYLIDFIDTARAVQDFPYLGKEGSFHKLTIFKLTVSKL